MLTLAYWQIFVLYQNLFPIKTNKLSNVKDINTYKDIHILLDSTEIKILPKVNDKENTGFKN